jgi:uncharacterized membrane protein YeiH
LGVFGGDGGGVVRDFFLGILEILHYLHFLSLYVLYCLWGWGLGGIPGSEAERTTCPNKRGRDKTEFCH